jgi:hypothetical protein
MDSTVSRFAKVMGASEVQVAGHDVRFAVDGAEGGRLRVSFEGDQQRLMGVLIDSGGVTRCSIDVAPVTKVVENISFPGRVTLHIGHCLIHIDSKPTLAIEIESDEAALGH